MSYRIQAFIRWIGLDRWCWWLGAKRVCVRVRSIGDLEGDESQQCANASKGGSCAQLQGDHEGDAGKLEGPRPQKCPVHNPIIEAPHVVAHQINDLRAGCF